LGPRRRPGPRRLAALGHDGHIAADRARLDHDGIPRRFRRHAHGDLGARAGKVRKVGHGATLARPAAPGQPCADGPDRHDRGRADRSVPMTTPNPAAMEFFLTRRSRPPKVLRPPVPTEAELLPILTAATRVPDHGKLEPWRFLVLEKPALTRMAGLARTRGAAMGLAPERIEKGVAQFTDADLIVAVVMVPRPTDKIPELEQVLSAGA